MDVTSSSDFRTYPKISFDHGSLTGCLWIELRQGMRLSLFAGRFRGGLVLVSAPVHGVFRYDTLMDWRSPGVVY
jgi:hypothetical protein